MAQLDFDFHAQPSRPGKLSIILALAGVMTLGWTWSALQTAHATKAGLAMQVAAFEETRPGMAIQPPAHANTTAQTDISAQLTYSWQPAFDALATARSSKIALVSLDAKQDKSQMKLVAEARELADALTFIKSLQEQPGIKRAALVQHEVQADDPQQPVRFTVLVELNG